MLVVQCSSRHGRIYYSDPDDGILSTGKTIYQSLFVRLYSFVCQGLLPPSKLVQHGGLTFLLQNLEGDSKGIIVVLLWCNTTQCLLL